MKRNYLTYFLWLLLAIVLGYIVLNNYTHFIPLFSAINFEPIRQIVNSPFTYVRYGYYLEEKLALPLVSFIIMGFWLSRKPHLFRIIKGHLPQILIIGLGLLTARFFSFFHWFFRDDYYIISNHFYIEYGKTLIEKLQHIPCCGAGFYPVGIYHLAMLWFGNNFLLYKILGFFFYWFIGITIYAIAGNLQKRKTVSLIAALFFLTSLTYFQETLLVGEFVGDSFTMLLFVLAVYFLVVKFWQGSFAFTAAALEFGLTRTYFIPVTLSLIGFFLAPYGLKIAKNIPYYLKVSSLAILGLIFLIPMFYFMPHTGSVSPFSFGLYLDTILGVTVPYYISKAVFSLFWWIFGSSTLTPIPIIFSLLVITALIGSLIRFIILKKYRAAWLIFTGLVTIFASAAIIAVAGSRVITDINVVMRYYVTDSIPLGYTGYGLFPAFGLVLIVIGFGVGLKPKLFNIIFSIFILLNTASFIYYDWVWIQKYSLEQRLVNAYMEKIIPQDGKMKLIYVPERERYLWQRIGYFLEIYRYYGDIKVAVSIDEFNSLLKKYNPDADHLYALSLTNDTLIFHDYSEKLRQSYPKNYVTVLKSLPDIEYK